MRVEALMVLKKLVAPLCIYIGLAVNLRVEA